MKRFAYVDRNGIMHVVAKLDTAREFKALGTTIVETEIKAEHGYPVVYGKQVIVYDEDCMKYDAKGKKIEPIAELAELYRKCR